MRVILKPGGVLAVLFALIGLTVLAITRGRQSGPSTGGDTPAATSSADGGSVASTGPKPEGGLEVPIVDDAYVAAADFANDPRKSLDYILIKSPATEDTKHIRVGYMKALLSAVPGASVKSAKLAFFATKIDASLRTQELIKAGQPMRLAVYGLNDNSWTSDKLTWNSQPAPDSYSKAGEVSMEKMGWYTVDVTDYVNQRLKADRVAGFRLSDDNKMDRVVSIDGSRSAANKPYLLIQS